MEEFMDTQVSAEQEGVVGSPVDDAEVTGQEGGNEQQVAEAATQEDEDRNSRMAAARRSGERAGYSKARKEADDEIASFGRIDPRTQKPIRTYQDVVAYLRGQEDAEIEAEASRSKRSTEDVRREREARKIGERQMNAAQQEEERSRRLKAEYDEFVDELGAEQAAKTFKKGSPFYKFAGKRIGNEPLMDIYNDYLEFAEGMVTTSAVKKESKAQRGTGSGSGAGSGDGLTSRERDALAEWNRNYPQYKMTEEEWKKR